MGETTLRSELKNIRPGECSSDGFRQAETIRSFCVFLRYSMILSDI